MFELGLLAVLTVSSTVAPGADWRVPTATVAPAKPIEEPKPPAPPKVTKKEEPKEKVKGPPFVPDLRHVIRAGTVVQRLPTTNVAGFELGYETPFLSYLYGETRAAFFPINGRSGQTRGFDRYSIVGMRVVLSRGSGTFFDKLTSVMELYVGGGFGYGALDSDLANGEVVLSYLRAGVQFDLGIRGLALSAEFFDTTAYNTPFGTLRNLNATIGLTVSLGSEAWNAPPKPLLFDAIFRGTNLSFHYTRTLVTRTPSVPGIGVSVLVPLVRRLRAEAYASYFALQTPRPGVVPGFFFPSIGALRWATLVGAQYDLFAGTGWLFGHATALRMFLLGGAGAGKAPGTSVRVVGEVGGGFELLTFNGLVTTIDVRNLLYDIPNVDGLSHWQVGFSLGIRAWQWSAEE